MGKAVSRHPFVYEKRISVQPENKDKTLVPASVDPTGIQESAKKNPEEEGALCDKAIAELTYSPDQSKKTKKNPRNTVYELTGLTVRHCRAVQESWKNLTSTNTTQIGIQFFMRFFLNYPEYRNFYPHFRSDNDVTDKETNRRELRQLRDSPAMRDLAAAYVEALTTIVNSLENLEEVTEILDNLTDRHLPRGVLSLHFQDMLSTLLSFMEEKVGHSNMNTTTRNSWTCALRTIITIIDQRYLELQHKQYFHKP